MPDIKANSQSQSQTNIQPQTINLQLPGSPKTTVVPQKPSIKPVHHQPKSISSKPSEPKVIQQPQAAPTQPIIAPSQPTQAQPKVQPNPVPPKSVTKSMNAGPSQPSATPQSQIPQRRTHAPMPPARQPAWGGGYDDWGMDDPYGGYGNFGGNYGNGFGAPYGSPQGPAGQLPKRLTPEERVQMIEKVYDEILGRKPDTRDINYYKYSTLDEEQIKKQLLASAEHKELMRKGREYDKLKESVDQAQSRAKNFEVQIKDQFEEFKQLNLLLKEKNTYIQKLRAEKEKDSRSTSISVPQCIQTPEITREESKPSIQPIATATPKLDTTPQQTPSAQPIPTTPASTTIKPVITPQIMEAIEPSTQPKAQSLEKVLDNDQIPTERFVDDSTITQKAQAKGRVKEIAGKFLSRFF